MIRDPINRTRYRTLQAALTLVALLALGGAITMMALPAVRPVELARGDRTLLERLAMVCIGVFCVLLLESIGATLYGGMFTDPTVDFFRLHFACTVLLYLAAVAVMRARVALRFSWGCWACCWR